MKDPPTPGTRARPRRRGRGRQPRRPATAHLGVDHLDPGGPGGDLPGEAGRALRGDPIRRRRCERCRCCYGVRSSLALLPGGERPVSASWASADLSDERSSSRACAAWASSSSGSRPLTRCLRRRRPAAAAEPLAAAWRRLQPGHGPSERGRPPLPGGPLLGRGRGGLRLQLGQPRPGPGQRGLQLGAPREQDGLVGGLLLKQHAESSWTRSSRARGRRASRAWPGSPPPCGPPPAWRPSGPSWRRISPVRSATRVRLACIVPACAAPAPCACGV